MTRFEKWGCVCLFCAAVAIAAPAQNFRTLASFDFFQTGANPQYLSLVQGTDGNIYGTATEGGVEGSGTVFKITAGGELTFLCDFGEYDCPGGGHPFAGLIQAADGNFYGTAWQGNASGSGTLVRLGHRIRDYGWGTADHALRLLLPNQLRRRRRSVLAADSR